MATHRASPDPSTVDTRLSTGVAGLDTILCGGFLPGRTYMVRGEPGVGKTALGLHFLADGAARDERVLFLTQGATQEAVRQDAASIGVPMDGVDFLDFTPDPNEFEVADTYDVFEPGDAERTRYVSTVVAAVRETRPTRVFLDALTQGRHLAEDVVEFRRQAHALLRFFVGEGATVVFASGSSDRRADEDLQFMSDGVLHLEYSPQGGRIVSVTKLRGSPFRLGRHSLRITDHGLEVYPRLVPEAHARPYRDEQIGTGIERLDVLLGGGIERGSISLVTGPSGVGKTTLATQFAKEAALRGERSVIYTFEEATATFVHRSEAIGMPISKMVAAGSLSIVEAEPLEYTADQFAIAVREEVEQREAKLVVLDSLSGYRLAIRGENLVEHVHALCRYLRNMGATVIVLYEVTSVTGDFRATEVGLSYLADNIVFLRYVEIDSELRRVIGVLKKRSTDFEKKLRELTITAHGIEVGEPLTGLRGILRGVADRVDGSSRGD
ncbi:MAG TPA: ATPase domain-containing protein [Gaiellaceae bacterium]|jgi:circadian clock protein KaiC